MKTAELNAARRLITKVLAKPSVGPGQRDDLRKAKRELDKIAQSGKLDKGRVFRVTETISQVLLDLIESDETRR
jgi:hypothetical protein